MEKNGVYSGNRLDTQERLEADLKKQFGEELIHLLKEAVGKTLEAVIGKAYSGYIGVDMITYQTPSGEYLIHPCIELNLRYTMGMLAIRLSERLIHKDSVGKFIVVFEKKKGKALELHVNDNKDNPLIWEADKIQEGYLSLCPVDEQTQYRAYIQISRINPEKEIYGTIKKDSEHK